MMVDGDKIIRIGAEMEDELRSRILPFWLNLADGENGGFIGEVASDGTVNTRARKGGILMSRILWTFSRAYCSFPDEKYREAADHVFAFIEKNMWDDEYEGIYYAVNYLGRPLDIKKHLYCESFAIYGLAEYHRAFGNERALNLAVRIFNRMEESASFTAHGGFLDICDRDWTLYPDLLSGRFFPPKTMNTHLHILEGLANLYRVYRDERLAKRLSSLIDIFLAIIINDKTHHFKLFFNDEWKSKNDVESYGHDIEGSWLLCEAAEILGDESLIHRTREEAVRMADAVYGTAIDDDGAIMYEGEHGKITDGNKSWWPQAENVIGMFNAWQISGEEKFLDASMRTWEFIRDHVIDREHGEWHANIRRDGTVDRGRLVSFWKCPYHNSRMVLEMKERINKSISR